MTGMFSWTSGTSTGAAEGRGVVRFFFVCFFQREQLESSSIVFWEAGQTSNEMRTPSKVMLTAGGARLTALTEEDAVVVDVRGEEQEARQRQEVLQGGRAHTHTQTHTQEELKDDVIGQNKTRTTRRQETNRVQSTHVIKKRLSGVLAVLLVQGLLENPHARRHDQSKGQHADS